ncbi:response regulator [Pleurocapsales cyanobacterium LEGE 06147]|nr:response regulator [Pleurocapsales cyanobacterium LEGE 06147]
MSYYTEVNNSRPSREKMRKIRVLIVDDQHLNRKLLEVILDSEPDLEIVGTAEDGREALAQIEMLHPDIALMGIEMPGMDGITTTETICQRFPNTKVIIITSPERQEYVNRSLKAGAKGFLLKDTPAKELADAIRLVNQDYLQFGPGLFKQVDEEVVDILANDKDESEDNLDKATSTDIVLSPTRLPSTATTRDDWSMATKDLLDALPLVSTRGLLYFLAIFTGVVLPWSILAKVDETGMARGKLEPKEKTIELDAPVSGTVETINVREGEIVKAGQILVELESDVIRAELKRMEEQQTGQLNRLTQLELLQNHLFLSLRAQQQQNQAQQLEKQAQVEQARQSLDTLKTIYRTQKEEKLAQLDQAKQGIEVSNAAYRLAEVALAGAREKVSRYRKAFQHGIISKDRLQDIELQVKENQERLVQARSEAEQAQSRLKEQQSNYNKLIQQIESEIEQAQLSLQEQQRSYQSLVHSGELALLKTEEQLKDLETQITTLKAEIAQSKSQIASLQFQLKQRVLKAPASGTVFHLPVSGAGAVVQSGEEIIELAPENSPLVLRAQMSPTETGFLRLGMPVKIKFDAYPFQDYGVLPGRVSWFSPDSKIRETAKGNQETFEIEIELERSYLLGQNKPILLTAGQTATAEVIVRQRRLIDFILDPFKKLQKGGLEL